MQSIETPRTFALRHDTTTLGVLRRCATALICTAGVALVFWLIGMLLGIGSSGYGNADCTGKHHAHQPLGALPGSLCVLSSDGVASSLALGQVPELPTSSSVPAPTSIFAPPVGSVPKFATPQGRLDYLNSMFRWPVMALDVLIVLVFSAGAVLVMVVPSVLTWVRWGGTREARIPDLMLLFAPRTRVWFAWFALAAAAAGESVRLTSLSEKLFDDGFLLAVASGVVASWLLLTVVIGFLNGLIGRAGEIRTSFLYR
ncbi:hypothetical protein Q0M94_25335 (plasmid) [Deinococcus radiomollis]|uniref:hypothetical protein n=1 Tax=Deinococcus radiomollis TaxID=468916 RepID=UPI003891EDB7